MNKINFLIVLIVFFSISVDIQASQRFPETNYNNKSSVYNPTRTEGQPLIRRDVTLSAQTAVDKIGYSGNNASTIQRNGSIIPSADGSIVPSAVCCCVFMSLFFWPKTSHKQQSKR